MEGILERLITRYPFNFILRIFVWIWGPMPLIVDGQCDFILSFLELGIYLNLKAIICIAEKL
jgi:hypothetical protein